MIVSRMSSWIALGLSVLNVPTTITLLRILFVPFIIASMMAHQWMVAGIFFALASATDLIDGALARYLQQETFFGSFLDPIADKLLLISSFVGFALFYKASVIPPWFLVFIIGSELIVVALAFYWGVVKKSMVIRPTRLGKLTSFAQILFIGWLFLCSLVPVMPLPLFWLLLGLVVLARVCIYIDYGFIAFRKDSSHD